MTVWDDITDTGAEAEELRARAKVMREIRSYIDEKGWSRVTAASELHTSRLRLDELFSGRISAFSLSDLVTMADHVGIDLEHTL